MKIKIKIKNNRIFAPIKKEWLAYSPEERVKQEYICRLTNHYGFKLEQMEQDVAIISAKNTGGLVYADIVIWKSVDEKKLKKSPLIVVECKADQVTIREDDYYRGAYYASLVNAKFFVTTNLKETRIFTKIYKLDKKGPNIQLVEILNIPNANDANNDKEINLLLNQTKEFARDDFSRLLFKCHNIIRNNDKLSPEAAFDEISKILFIKTLYERKNQKGQIFLLEDYKYDKKAYDKNKNDDDLPFYRKLFDNVKKELKNDDLFELNETIKIRENSFEDIIKELEVYNLSTTDDDVKGIAFEQFLGRTFRGELGQFFTPRTIVNFMVEVLDPREGEIICDPCCGSGGFLIRAFEYVRSQIEQNIHKEKEKIKEQFFNKDYNALPEKKKEEINKTVNTLFNKLNEELDIKNPQSRLHALSYDCIFGTDANPRMSRTAKMNMIMHGDGHGGVHHNDGLLNINGIFENRFDIIITNPPFGSRVERTLKITESDKLKDISRLELYRNRYGIAYEDALKQINDNLNKPLLNLFDTGKISTLTEVLFLERCINLLKPGGRMAIVLPEGVLNNPNLQKIRDFFESKAKIILITSIPQDVFIASGATVKPSILFFKKFTLQEKNKWNLIKSKIEKKVNFKYASRLQDLTKQLDNRVKETKTNNNAKMIRTKLKQIKDQIEKEIKQEVKSEFDYKLAIAQVEQAGISTTGSEIENELKPLVIEFKAYRSSNKLWISKSKKINYKFAKNNITRLINGSISNF